MKFAVTRSSKGQGGFSLVELITVAAIIGVMAAIAVPSLAGYVRIYRIRGAAQEVSGEMQAARLKAVGRNVNFGVLFVVLPADPALFPPGTPANRYRWVFEDLPNPNPWVNQSGVPQPAPLTPAPLAWSDPGAQSGPIKTLPSGVFFDLAPPALPAPANAAPNACFARFTRLGLYTTAGTANPAGVCAATQIALGNGAGGTAVTLIEQRTGLRRTVRVRGGRIEAQQ